MTTASLEWNRSIGIGDRVEEGEAPGDHLNDLPSAPTATGDREIGPNKEPVETAPPLQTQPMDNLVGVGKAGHQSAGNRISDVSYKYNETLEERTSPAVGSGPPIDLVSSTTVPGSITLNLLIVSPLSEIVRFLLKSSIVASL